MDRKTSTRSLSERVPVGRLSIAATPVSRYGNLPYKRHVDRKNLYPLSDLQVIQ